MSKYSFTAYIDESGDGGFVFKPDGTGSSRWLILSALVVRRKNDSRMIQLMRDIRQSLKAQPKQALHFIKLDHSRRVAVARAIGGASFLRTVSVLIHKPSLREPEKFRAQKDLLYRYACRYLLERVSWLCEEHHIEGEGIGLAEVIFSNRDQMSYGDLKDYLRVLRDNTDSSAQPMAWKHIDPEHVRAVQHTQLAGLQLADTVASGLYAALAPNRFGDTEDRYARLLEPTFRRYKGVVLGFGLKFWPEDFETMKPKDPHLAGLSEWLGK
ncbi:MAG: hypothetical protein SynsKO_34750 [Synoicihabitans sp.]